MEKKFYTYFYPSSTWQGGDVLDDEITVKEIKEKLYSTVLRDPIKEIKRDIVIELLADLNDCSSCKDVVTKIDKALKKLRDEEPAAAATNRHKLNYKKPSVDFRGILVGMKKEYECPNSSSNLTSFSPNQDMNV